jgi:glycerol kinase
VVNPPEPGLILSLDQGGHTSRALIFDAQGRELAAAHVPVGTRQEAAGRVEQEPEELLRSLQLAARDACESAAVRDQPVTTAGLATQRSTIVCWQQSSGRPLTSALSWQDRRNAGWLERLRPQASAIRAMTGLVLSPHYGASKMRWCLDNVPAVQRAARANDLAVGPLASFLTSRLLEERPFVVDPANAARTLLFDPAMLDWSPQLLDAFAIARRCLPRCVPTRHDYGTLPVGQRRVPLRACTGDQSAAAFAFGQPQEDTAFVNVGTGAFVQRLAPAGAPLPDGLLRSVLWSDGDRATYSHEGTVNGAASAIDWLRGRIALDVDRALQAMAGRPESEVPLFMNGVGGLGAPFWKADFPVEFVGAGDELQQLISVLESIAFLLCVNLAVMQTAAPQRRILISGGLASSDYLCRALADLSGLGVERYTVREATARGVAFLAAGQPVDWEPVPVQRVFTPSANPALTERQSRWRAEMARRGAVT